ncbi:MAG: amino acid-binding protein [Lachnospiraceae bacterium]|nr:amino acid-binding protein [Lachnospiraceae bacterium]
MLKQVSIFAENQKGAFQAITGILQEEGINILGSVTNDSAEYGIVRMIVSDTEKTLKALTARGYLCRSNDILGVEMEDKIGSLNNLLISLSEGNISVDYIYLCFNRETGKPVLILHTDEIFEVEEYLKAKGFSVQ